MNFLRRIFFSCFSFERYREIACQKRWKSIRYFTLLIAVACTLVYPSFFRSQTRLIFPVLEDLAKRFPDVRFENSKIVSEFDEHRIIENPFLSIVVDPDGTFRHHPFLRAWILFNRRAMQFNFGSESGRPIPYRNPSILALFMQLAQFDESGSGVLQGDFFLKLKEAIREQYFSWGILFGINWLIVAFLFSLVLSVPGYLYGKMLRCPLGWREVRNLSDYALTPVVVLAVCCYAFGLGFSRLQPVFFLAYTLFLFGAIQIFRVSPEESPGA